MNLFKNKFKNSGSGLIEIIIGSAILLLVVLSSVDAYNTYINYSLSNQDNSRVIYLLEEGIEAVIYLKNENFSSNISALTGGSSYYLYFNGLTWSSTTTPQYIDSKFLRSFSINSVNRDANNDIASSGSNDPDTKKVTISVSHFAGHSTTTKTLSTYITNLYNN